LSPNAIISKLLFPCSNKLSWYCQGTQVYFGQRWTVC